MKDQFDQIFEDIITRWETDKFTNDPRDPGGGTKYGLSQRANPDLDIQRLTKAGAKARYLERYWGIMGLDGIEDYGVCKQMFQQGINQGIQSANYSLQLVMNALRTFLKVDGVIGPRTLAAVNGYHTPSEIVWGLRGEQYMKYANIVRNDPEQAAFFRGWLRRTFLS